MLFEKLADLLVERSHQDDLALVPPEGRIQYVTLDQLAEVTNELGYNRLYGYELLLYEN